MNIQSLLQCTNYSIGHGSQLPNSMWENAWEYRIWSNHPDVQPEYWTNYISVTFNNITGEVYSLSVPFNGSTYCWFSPNIKSTLEDYSTGINEYEVDEEEDILEKAESLVKNLPFDTRIVVKLDLSDDELVLLQRSASLKDQTIDEYMHDVISSMIDRYKELNDE